MYSFFKCLTQQVLTTLGIGNMTENRKHQVVTNKAFSSRKEPKVTHDDHTFIIGKLIRLPDFNILGHRYFCGHPVVSTPIEIVFPGPMVLQWHQLVNIDLIAVNQAFVPSVNATGILLHQTWFIWR